MRLHLLLALLCASLPSALQRGGGPAGHELGWWLKLPIFRDCDYGTMTHWDLQKQDTELLKGYYSDPKNSKSGRTFALPGCSPLNYANPDTFERKPVDSAVTTT